MNAYHHRFSFAFAALALTSLAALPAVADVIYEQPLDPTGAFASDWGNGEHAADDFVLLEGAATITDIHWWGLYVSSDTPQAVDYFTIVIWADDGGSPGATAALNLATSDVNRTDTGTDVLGFDLYSYSVDISPLALTAGTTYWISILNDTTADTNDTWYWARGTGSTNDHGIFRRPVSTTGDEFEWYQGGVPAFQLTNDNLGGEVVPEPATMTLLGLGLAGLAYRQRKRQS